MLHGEMGLKYAKPTLFPKCVHWNRLRGGLLPQWFRFFSPVAHSKSVRTWANRLGEVNNEYKGEPIGGMEPSYPSSFLFCGVGFPALLFHSYLKR